MVEKRAPSIRRRVVGAATAVVAAALVVGAVAFLALFRASLIDAVRLTAGADASSIASRLEATGSRELTAAERADDDRLILLLDGDEVVASNDAAESVRFEGGDDLQTITVDDESYLAASESADNGLTVVVGVELEDVDQSLASITPLVAVAIPVLLALVAGVTWVVVGRALRPVESMRREVEQIRSTSLGTRIDEPATGDEIHRLAVTMNGMLERLESSQRAQAQFVSDASHELRSPLASLRQFAEVAQSYPGQVSAEELATAIRDEGGRLESIVRGMLLLARADERAVEPARGDVDLDDLLFSEASRLRVATSLEIDTAGVVPCRVTGDDDMLAQVVRNLADNAARHASSRISFSLNEQPGSVVLMVEDDGAGIPEHDRDRVFERFVRLDEARARESGGSGLGLAIVRELVALHGGRVRVEQGASGGARFVVELPIGESRS